MERCLKTEGEGEVSEKIGREGWISKNERTLGEIRDKASKVVGLLLGSFDDIDEGVQVALDGREEPAVV